MATARFLLLGWVFGLGVGCGPMQTPLPRRLEDKDQQEVNGAWENALSQVDRYDNQTLLDMLICTRGYQHGVDKLEFRSEKIISIGTVIMEIHFDRAAPAEDRFEIRVVDAAGKTLRKERYEREQIERTDKELWVESNQLWKKKEQGNASPEEEKKLASLEARLKTVEKISPEYARQEEQKRKEAAEKK